MSRYFLVVVLAVFGCVSNGTAQEKPGPMPVIDCVVEYAHGDFSYFTDNSVASSDTITLDLNAVDKISLDFNSNNPVPSYIPHGVFQAESVNRRDDPDYSEKPDPFFWMKLVARGSFPRVTIYIRRLLPIVKYPQRQYDLIITTETVTPEGKGFVDGILVLKGTARN